MRLTFCAGQSCLVFLKPRASPSRSHYLQWLISSRWLVGRIFISRDTIPPSFRPQRTYFLTLYSTGMFSDGFQTLLELKLFWTRTDKRLENSGILGSKAQVFPIEATYNSNRGMVIYFVGDILDFAACSRVEALFSETGSEKTNTYCFIFFFKENCILSQMVC